MSAVWHAPKAFPVHMPHHAECFFSSFMFDTFQRLFGLAQQEGTHCACTVQSFCISGLWALQFATLQAQRHVLWYGVLCLNFLTESWGMGCSGTSSSYCPPAPRTGNEIPLVRGSGTHHARTVQLFYSDNLPDTIVLLCCCPTRCCVPELVPHVITHALRTAFCMLM